MVKSASWLWIPRSRPQAQLRLFCFPYAGGGASAFREWIELLPDFIELALVQLPGREARFGEPVASDLPSVVHALADAASVLPGKPYATFGHSLGTLLSYEFVLEMGRRGLPAPLHVLMSGRGAPHLVGTRANSHRLPDDEFIASLRQMQGTPPEVLDDAELMRLLLPTLRADFSLAENYRRDQPEMLSCSMSIYGGLADSGVHREHLLEWQKYTSGSTALRMFPGGHFFLHSARYVLLQALARDLHAQLDGRSRLATVDA